MSQSQGGTETFRIEGVRVAHQQGVPLYSFVLTAAQLRQIGRVERFHETTQGVQRKLDTAHRDGILASMRAGVLFMEPIAGDLVGRWEFREAEGVLIAYDGAYFSIDDGGHRYEAALLMDVEWAARYDFNIVVTNNLPLAQRMRLFRQQMRRKNISTPLVYAQQHRIGEWDNPRDAETYRMLVQLNGDANSPLFGLITLEEQVGRRSTQSINAMPLMSALQTLFARTSPLHDFSYAERLRVITTLLRAARELWPTEWAKEEGYILRTSKGIQALLLMMRHSSNFRGHVGDSYPDDKIVEALRRAGSFNWSSSHNKKRPLEELVKALDKSIGSRKTKS
jgi:DGQHR domain-containing protein